MLCLFFFVFTLTFFCCRPDVLPWSSPSYLPLRILLLISLWKFSLFLQIGVYIFESFAFWKPFIPIFIPTTVMCTVFHLFAPYGNLYRLCFIKKRPMNAQHSFTLLEFGLQVCFSAIYRDSLPPPHSPTRWTLDTRDKRWKERDSGVKKTIEVLEQLLNNVVFFRHSLIFIHLFHNSRK